MKENELIITDDQGNEHRFEIAFTFSDDDNQHDYAVASNDGENYFVFEFFEETKEMEVVSDEAILDRANELIASYFNLDEVVDEEN